MNVASEWALPFDALRRSYEQGRLAHAYIVVGSPRGAAADFAEAVLILLLADGDATSATARRILQQVHPDVVRVEPQSKKRVIRVDEMRILNQRIQQTATEGAWKVGIISYADRLNEQAANAFLKTLEEPAGQTLLLLLTETPHTMLPTVRSRCQRIVLPGKEELPAQWREKLLPILRDLPGGDPAQALMGAQAMRTLLDDVRTSIESAMDQADGEDAKGYAARVQSRLLEVRAQVMAMVMNWQRDVLFAVVEDHDPAKRHFPDEQGVIDAQAEGVSFAAAMGRIAAVEEMARRLERLLPPLITFDVGFNRYRRRKAP